MSRPHTRMQGRWLGVVVAASFVALLAALPVTAAARDRNHDRIPDRWERRHHLSLQVNQANRDQDGDELENLGEYQAGTDPRDKDTDGDGTPDVEENAGEVASFTPGAEEGTGTLVIDLYAGGQLTGEVTERTRIVCRPEVPEEEATVSRNGPPFGGPPADGTEEGTEEEGDVPSFERPGEPGGPGCHRGTPCTTEDLVTGAVVHQADINVSANGNTFRLIALG